MNYKDFYKELLKDDPREKTTEQYPSGGFSVTDRDVEEDETLVHTLPERKHKKRIKFLKNKKYITSFINKNK